MLPALATNETLINLGLLGQSGPSASWSWAIVGFFIILGLLVTLTPSRRTTEIKRTKDD
jgi:hypothetical protein